MSAASAAAPPGSAPTLTAPQRRRCASRIASSVTSTEPTPCALITAHGTAPVRRAPSESEATPLTSTSTGAPAASAAAYACEVTGSTATTRA